MITGFYKPFCDLFARFLIITIDNNFVFRKYRLLPYNFDPIQVIEPFGRKAFRAR
jgi:hypothetical protein